MKPFSGEKWAERVAKLEAKSLPAWAGCVHCGARVARKGKGSGLHAHVVEGGGRYASEAEHVSGAAEEIESMGLWPVGSECAKALKAAGVYVFSHEWAE